MAIEEPDLAPTKSTDGDPVASEGFDRVRRGFAPDQVAEYLKRVAASVLTLESRLEETRNELFDARRERDAARAELAAVRPDPYEGVSERVTELMRTFDQQVDDLQRQAQAEADRILYDVRTDADRIIVQAREEAERIMTDAREDAERIMTDANEDAERARATAQSDEAESRILAERIVQEAKEEANRAESDVAAMRNSTLETFRDIRSRTLAALGELELVIESGAIFEPVVIVDEADDVAASTIPEMPRPDL